MIEYCLPENFVVVSTQRGSINLEAVTVKDKDTGVNYFYAIDPNGAMVFHPLYRADGSLKVS